RAAPPIRVRGNRLIDGRGRRVRLLGVNKAGTEYECLQYSRDGVPPHKVFDGPSDDRAIAVMRSWHVNTVRILLNEDCWLGINGTPPAVGGVAYQDAIAAFVDRLRHAGLYTILALHATAAGSTPATGGQRMADADHAPTFWSSVAGRFQHAGTVLFDLYNEPHDITWPCWRDGCTTDQGVQLAGMQELLDAVRKAGARQPVLVGGLAFSSILTHWLEYAPRDPAGALVASVHVYDFAKSSDPVLWGVVLQPLAKQVPLVAGEIGETDCGHAFIDNFMKWADSQNVSYLGWTWNSGPRWECRRGPALIRNYRGAPTAYGLGLRRHLTALARR
ncbi:MAG: hypothetical protein JWN32_3798, partial [Solirubrobacterales bacterium]|nr:hypothetical protein [Solirubrobacterales bacterium]